jgi:hydroxymethylpyrimidine pyrophosphatase-like HAD family hydrolase
MESPKIRAIATDFDGTLTSDGTLHAATSDALRRARAAGMILILITGRELRDLRELNTDLTLFDLAVLENGALLLRPDTNEITPLAPPPITAFVEELQRCGVAPLSVGMSIVATLVPHEVTVIEAIRHLGLELSLTFNKGSIMVLPPNVNKASGLVAALQVLGLQSAEVAGIGDGENDHAFIDQCGLAVAVANAIPMLQEHADLVTHGAEAAGVLELIDGLLSGSIHVAVEA